MPTLYTRTFALVSLVFPLSACSSAPDSSAFGDDPAVDDSSIASDGGNDTASPGDSITNVDTGLPAPDSGISPSDSTPPIDTTPPPIDSGPGPVTLDNVCARLADAVCTPTTRACCTGRGVDYSEKGCRDNITGYCGGLVDDVTSGDRTFDASKFDDCAAAWHSLTLACSVPVLTYIKTYAACDALLNGSIAPGDGVCTDATDCKAAPGALSDCTTSTCANYLIVSKDQPCNYDGTTKRFCDYGLYCPYTASPKCMTQKAIGSGCFGSDPSCGWGNRCDPTGHCAVGLALGASCFADNNCASATCDTGHCSDPNVEMAIPSTCGG